MTGLQSRLHRLWIALCLVLGLTVLPAITASLLGEDLASWFPGTDVVLADESANGSG